MYDRDSSSERKKMGKEVINISETLSDGAVVLLNEDVFEENNLDTEEIQQVINSFFVLAYNSINHDLSLAGKHELIEISEEPVLEELVSMVRMLLFDNGEFQLLVYFGKLANPKTTVRQGLLHVLELLALVEPQIV